MTRRATPGSRPRSGQSAGEGLGGVARGGGERAKVLRLRSARRTGAPLPFDLDLGLADAHDAHAVELVALAHEAVVDQGDGLPVALRDRLQDQGRRRCLGRRAGGHGRSGEQRRRRGRRRARRLARAGGVVGTGSVQRGGWRRRGHRRRRSGRSGSAAVGRRRDAGVRAARTRRPNRQRRRPRSREHDRRGPEASRRVGQAAARHDQEAALRGLLLALQLLEGLEDQAHEVVLDEARPRPVLRGCRGP